MVTLDKHSVSKFLSLFAYSGDNNYFYCYDDDGNHSYFDITGDTSGLRLTVLSYRLLHYPLDLLSIPNLLVVLIVLLLHIQFQRVIYDSQSHEDRTRDEFRKVFTSNTCTSVDSVKRRINPLKTKRVCFM
jgi:hypothetical protein